MGDAGSCDDRVQYMYWLRTEGGEAGKAQGEYLIVVTFNLCAC